MQKESSAQVLTHCHYLKNPQNIRLQVFVTDRTLEVDVGRTHDWWPEECAQWVPAAAGNPPRLAWTPLPVWHIGTPSVWCGIVSGDGWRKWLEVPLEKTPRHLGGSQTMVKRQGLDWWGLSPNGETGNTMNSSSSSQWWIITMRYFIIIFTIVISTSITPPCCLGSVNPFDNPKTINDTQWLNPRRSSLHLKASKFGDIWGYPRNLQFYCSCNGKKT